MQPLQVGVCSWSLAIPDLNETLATIKNKLDLNLVQVGFFDDGYRQVEKVVGIIKSSGLEISATCVGFAGEDYSTIQRIAATGGYLPDDDWDHRLSKTITVADITARLGLDKLIVHVGFVPEDKSDPKHAVMVNRLQQICDHLAEHGVTLVMETGQEKPEDLLEFIAAVGRNNIGINFDPANMILYGIEDPNKAIDQLIGRIVHVHMKDANWAANPRDEWGEEVVLGTGQANIPSIVGKLKAAGYTGPLVIEREAGNQRIADIKTAIKLLDSL